MVDHHHVLHVRDGRVDEDTVLQLLAQRGGDLSPAEFGRRAASELETAILLHGPERVAAFIGEPVQGAGGVIIPPDSYWPEVQRICDRYGILLISDEVICGFGRTGQWVGCERYGTRPTS